MFLRENRVKETKYAGHRKEKTDVESYKKNAGENGVEKRRIIAVVNFLCLALSAILYIEARGGGVGLFFLKALLL